MSKRILAAVVAVAASAVAVFAVPLGVAVSRLYRDQEVITLQRQATLAGLAVPVGLTSSGDPIELPRVAGIRQIAVYGADGRRVDGTGPPRADGAVARALAGHVAGGLQAGSIVVAVPLSVDEQVYAAIRAAVPRSVVDTRVHRAWMAMTALAATAIILAALLGLRQSRRLARPIADLADEARRLGDGEFSAAPTPSGIAEIDSVGRSLRASSDRLGDLVRRERAFSEGASHQLRTPVTALRLSLDNALSTPGTDPRKAMADAIRQLDRLEATVEDLLRLARARPDVRATFDVRAVLDEARETWHSRVADQGRRLRVVLDGDLPPGRMSAAAVRQVIDVLVDNALRHGTGVVTIRARSAGAGLVIEVTDEGPGLTGDPPDVFAGAPPPGHGIGLAMARSLAEAEGNRLRLAQAGPGPVFALVIGWATPVRAAAGGRHQRSW